MTNARKEDFRDKLHFIELTSIICVQKEKKSVGVRRQEVATLKRDAL